MNNLMICAKNGEWVLEFAGGIFMTNFFFLLIFAKIIKYKYLRVGVFI